MQYPSLVDHFADGCREIFGENLVGVYLHGSLAMGCFNPEKSDIDLLAVTEAPADREQKRRLLALCVALNEEAPPKGLEMSLVRHADCLRPVHPIPFDLHFSPAHLDWYRRDVEDYLDKMHGSDPDLAAHFTITRARGVCVWGAPIAEVFGEVPRRAYLDSILSDIESAEEDVCEDPVYVTLNLCRVCAFAEEGLIQSKREGGEWALESVPEYAAFVGAALNSYNTGAPFAPEPEAARAFCRKMLERIHTAITEEH